jgi:hypothetical protein
MHFPAPPTIELQGPPQPTRVSSDGDAIARAVANDRLLDAVQADAAASHLSPDWHGLSMNGAEHQEAASTRRLRRAKSCEGQDQRARPRAATAPPSPSPSLRVQEAGGLDRPVDNSDYDPSNISVSGSSQSDFATIETISDFGFGLPWVQRPLSRHSSLRRPRGGTSREASPSRPHFLRPERTSREVLGIGDDRTVSEDRFDVEAFNEDLKDAHHSHETHEDCDATSHFGNGRKLEFMSYGRLMQVVSRENVSRKLAEAFPRRSMDEVTEMADKICADDHASGLRMIFATLLFLPRLELIDDFLEAGIYDTHLPLRKGTAGKAHFHTRLDEDDCADPRTCFEHWNGPTLRMFCQTQYNVLVPMFHIPDDRVFRYAVSPSMILPFIEWTPMDRGGYGTVAKAKIHPAHHNYGGGKSVCTTGITQVVRIMRCDADVTLLGRL